MATEELDFEKLKQDSEWLEQLLRSASESLRKDGTLEVLKNEVASRLAERECEEEILRRAREARETLEQTQRRMAELRASRAKEEKRLKTDLLRLKNEKSALEVKSCAEADYLEAWLDSRREQEKIEADFAQRELSEGLRRCEMREKNERMVTSEIEAFLQQSIEENEKATLNWISRRQTESKRYEKEIHGLREQIERKRAELEKLRHEYDERQKFINSCLAEKEALRQRLELEEHRRSRAVQIQAWWRGVMVRRKLGPYRPEEKKRKRQPKPKK